MNSIPPAPNDTFFLCCHNHVMNSEINSNPAGIPQESCDPQQPVTWSSGESRLSCRNPEECASRTLLKHQPEGVGCSGKHGEVLSPLAMAHHMGSNIYSLRSLNSEVGVLEPGFPGNSFVVNLKGIEKKKPTLLCSHYQVI